MPCCERKKREATRMVAPCCFESDGSFRRKCAERGVFIYLQSVQIKDIPTQCYLGKENNVGKEGYGLSFPENGPDMQDGEILYYHKGELPGEDFVYGEACADHRITSGHPKLEFDPHAEDAPALYFYENMQGAGVDMPDKRQDANGDNILDFPDCQTPRTNIPITD